METIRVAKTNDENGMRVIVKISENAIEQLSDVDMVLCGEVVDKGWGEKDVNGRVMILDVHSEKELEKVFNGVYEEIETSLEEYRRFTDTDENDIYVNEDE